MTSADFEQFLNENFLTFLLLGGLLIVMYAYRDVKLPAERYFLLIILIVFAMSLASGVERWSCLSADREPARIISSVIHYILQPMIIYLELIIIRPNRETSPRTGGFLLALPLILNTIIYVVAPFTGNLVFSFNANYEFERGALGYSVYIVTYFYLALLFLWSFRFLKSDEKRKGIILFFMVGTGVLTGVLEALNLVTGYVDEAFALGIFLYYMYLITLHESDMQTSLAMKELELSQNKVTLLRQQIRPHFVFNSLHIIKSLIRTDQDLAVRSIEDFSEYLRANVDAIASDRLIPFDEELSLIRAYVSLALADKSKNITVNYEIGERDFRLPILSIEPLVENAIRHGVALGGTVTLLTKSTPDEIIIIVSDDGKGFAASRAAGQSLRPGSGIANVRARLAAQCNGTLEIDSDENGTEVTVRLPRQV